jgi:hypothetical protein
MRLRVRYSDQIWIEQVWTCGWESSRKLDGIKVFERINRTNIPNLGLKLTDSEFHNEFAFLEDFRTELCQILMNPSKNGRVTAEIKSIDERHSCPVVRHSDFDLFHKITYLLGHIDDRIGP